MRININMPIQVDIESLGVKPDCMVISMGLIYFPSLDDIDSDEWKEFNRKGIFKTLCDNSLYLKFDLKSQKGKRSVDHDTIAWWKKQDVDASYELIPSDIDVTLEDGIEKIIEFFNKHNFIQKTDLLYSRGNNFDIPILENIFNQCNVSPTSLYRFYNVRDVRTEIGTILNERTRDKINIRKELLDGFVHHNPIHDVAKDIMMMFYAQKYAFGDEDIPSNEESHIATIDKR